MKLTFAVPLALSGVVAAFAACSSGGATPDGACRPTDPTCNPTPEHDGGGPIADAAGDARIAPSSDGEAAAQDSGVCRLWVDDAGVTQGCGAGGMGPGDRDDGGGGPPPPPPDAALDATGLGFGASCWDNAQCASDLCFDYKVRGTFCSRICTTNLDCPPPSPGCNGMGVCRMADTGGDDGG